MKTFCSSKIKKNLQKNGVSDVYLASLSQVIPLSFAWHGFDAIGVAI
jgi:hypothetical protein